MLFRSPSDAHNWMDECRRMFPAELLPRIQPVGNAAGEGARIALLNEEERKEMDRTVKNMDFVELAASPEFQDCFVDGLCFP